MKKTKEKTKKSLVWRIVKFAVICVVGLFLLGILAGLSVFVYYSKDLPRPEDFNEKTFAQSTKIYDRTGQTLLYELYGDQKREVVPLSAISKNLQQAVIATEDASFYTNRGLDFKAIARSIISDLKLGQPAFGASTITQQLIRSTYLTTQKTAERKVREIILTMELEQKYSKDQILEWYLNQIPFGPNLYGAQTASQTYFGKDAKDLTINESATLAAMIQSPSYYDPYGSHLDDLITRKNYVLDRMVAEHYITEDQADSAKKETLAFAPDTQNIKAPFFVLYVEDYLLQKYGQDALQNGGYKVYTTLDWNMEQEAEKAVADGVKKNRVYNANNAALVAIDPKTGEILSMVGSADWFGAPYPAGCTSGVNCMFDPKVNVATYYIGRQPGSSFKPFVYATAFEKGYSDQTVVVDEPTDFGSWGGKDYEPQNFDGKFRGPVTLRSALAQSLNVPSVKVLDYLAGLDDSIATAKAMGITTLTQPASYYGLSIVLGGGEVKLLDMVSAYGVFANDGVRLPPIAVTKIVDANGNIIEQSDASPKNIIDPNIAREISSILSDNNARAPIFGYNSPLYFPNYQVAVKTGTTQNYKDGWIIGYTPSFVAGVWAGNNDGTVMTQEPSYVVAGPLWHVFMNEVLPTLPKESFPPFVEPSAPTPAPASDSSLPIPTPVPSPTPAP